MAIAGNIEAYVELKNCAPFIKCITKIGRTMIDDVEDLNLVMPMYSLIEYSSNYSEKNPAILWLFLYMKQLILM